MVQLRSMATPSLEADLDDDQIRNMLGFTAVSYRREKQVPTDHEFYHSFSEKLCQVHLTSDKVHGKLAAVFLTQKESRVKRTRYDREGTSSGHQPVQGEGRSLLQVL